MDPEPILPSKLIVSPIVRTIDHDIQQATLQEPAPPECPEGKIYVPSSQRLNLLGTVHQSPGSGHPDSKRTLSSLLIQARYWWPSMRRDTIRYVQSCSVCAMTNSLRMLSAGKLVPLPIPERPWSHLGVDFVTDLPSSEGYTCVLVIVDNFSKMCRFVPLEGLLTAMETAEHLFHQVFHLFGIPEEIVPSARQREKSKNSDVTSRHTVVETNWSRILPWAEYTQNSLRQDTTGLTPFQCVLGYQPPLFPWTEEPSNVPAVDHWFRESERVWDSTHHHLQRAIRWDKDFADARRRGSPRYQPGDLVWLSTRDLPVESSSLTMAKSAVPYFKRSSSLARSAVPYSKRSRSLATARSAVPCSSKSNFLVTARSTVPSTNEPSSPVTIKRAMPSMKPKSLNRTPALPKPVLPERPPEPASPERPSEPTHPAYSPVLAPPEYSPVPTPPEPAPPERSTEPIPPKHPPELAPAKHLPELAPPEHLPVSSPPENPPESTGPPWPLERPVRVRGRAFHEGE
ncbi:hypothetical protein M9458_025818, partial [Cirrhinus mrigala]